MPRFDGSDYQPSRDDERLAGQHEKIRRLMIDGRWRTLAAIAAETHEPPASVSAQLRHLRKPRFGSYRVEKRYLGDGLYEYQVLPPPPSGQQALF